jgi:iron complex transport system ATP-binding protein
VSLVYELHNTSVRYGEVFAVNGVSVALARGEFVAVAGPNGAGKSTLLGVMAGLKGQFTGDCLFLGKDVRRWPRRPFARRVSVVPQAVRIDFPFTAEQVVLMGRTPFADTMFESNEDADHVQRAMALTGTTQFRRRDFRSLSGGERQRVVLASALAQAPEVLLLDEPTTYLDLEHQISLYKLLRSLAGDGLLIVSITHDLNLASTFSDRMLLLRSGALVADGPPDEVINRKVLRDVFRVDTPVEPGVNGRPWIHYDGA